MKRTEFLKGTVSSLALLSLHGCLTKKLYETHGTEYEETALSFLVTEDGSQVVAVGKSYHYIFHDITPSLKEILTGRVDGEFPVELGVGQRSRDEDEIARAVAKDSVGDVDVATPRVLDVASH